MIPYGMWFPVAVRWFRLRFSLLTLFVRSSQTLHSFQTHLETHFFHSAFSYGYSSSWKPLIATGNHEPWYGITQCYLPPGSSDFSTFTPSKAGTRFIDPRGMQGWVYLSGGYIPRYPLRTVKNLLSISYLLSNSDDRGRCVCAVLSW